MIERLMRWVSPRELREKGVLGINGRNADFIALYNERAMYPRVDDKLLTKAICAEHRIPIPRTYGVVSRYGEIGGFFEIAKSQQQFVVKPCQGSGGRGIKVVVAHDAEGFTSPSGNRTTPDEMRYHLGTILSGLYSLGGQPDRVIVEQRIVCHPEMERVSFGGTPDVRIILLRGVPVMAMTRLPTSASGGRANLHQGAIAAAIDLLTGVTTGGVCRNRAMTVHPDTGNSIEGFGVPGWSEVLPASMRLADAIGLGYVGVDFVVDAALGAVVLEANARPGLAIQVANRRGLRPRLEFVAGQPPERLAPERRMALVEELVRL